MCEASSAVKSPSSVVESLSLGQVLGKTDRRPLEVAADVPRFWRKDRQSLPTFLSFVYVSTEGMSGKLLCGAKNPAETRTTPTMVISTSK